MDIISLRVWVTRAVVTEDRTEADLGAATTATTVAGGVVIMDIELKSEKKWNRSGKHMDNVRFEHALCVWLSGLSYVLLYLAKREVLLGLIVRMAHSGSAQGRLCWVPEQSHVLYQIRTWIESIYYSSSVL